LPNNVFRPRPAKNRDGFWMKKTFQITHDRLVFLLGKNTPAGGRRSSPPQRPQKLTPYDVALYF
jgi:hypothetical protein